MGVFSLSPLPSGSAAGGDVVYRTDSSRAILRPHTGNVLVCGSLLNGKVNESTGLDVRFELDFLAGTVFLGARLNLWVSSTTGSGAKPATFGIHDHDIDGNWTQSDGWSHADYSFSGDIETPVNVDGTAFEDTAYYADAGHRISEDVADYGTNDRFGIATGILSGEIVLASLLAELQAWFDAKESLRDTGVGSGIPISFAFASDKLTAPDPNREFKFFDIGDATFKPTLDIETQFPGPITARSAIEPTMSARSTIVPTMSARSTIAPAMSATSKILPTISARSMIEPTMQGRAVMDLHYRTTNTIRLDGPTNTETGALSSGGACSALLFHDRKDSVLEVAGASPDTDIFVEDASRYEANVDRILIEKSDGSYHDGGVCTAVDVNLGKVTIPNALGEAFAKASRVGVRLGGLVTLDAYGTPVADTFNWGYRGQILDTHADLKIGLPVRGEIKLVDGGVVLNKIERATVVGGS